MSDKVYGEWDYVESKDRHTLSKKAGEVMERLTKTILTNGEDLEKYNLEIIIRDIPEDRIGRYSIGIKANPEERDQ